MHDVDRNGSPDGPQPWPLWDLVLRTPRLELRPDDDPGLVELSALAADGVHPPEYMPFTQPWTDLPAGVMERGNLQFHWRNRGELSAEKWTVSLLARMDGVLVGAQDIAGTDFAGRREVTSGSWLGLRYQNQGLGKEMRAAMLLFAFDHLGARAAVTSAWHDNPRSLAVSAALGYRLFRTSKEKRRGVRTEMRHLRVHAAEFVRPQWTLEVSGVDGCLGLLGVG